MANQQLGREGCACLRCVEEAAVWLNDQPVRARRLVEKAQRMHVHLDLRMLASLSRED